MSTTEIALTPAHVAEIASMLGVKDEMATALSLVKDSTDAGLPEAVKAAMALYRDPEAADSIAKAARLVASDAAKARDAHTDYRVSVVAAILAHQPKAKDVDVVTMMFGPDAYVGKVKTQMSRDRAILAVVSAAGTFNIAAKAKDPKAKGVVMTRAMAAKAVRGANAKDRAAIVKTLATEGHVPETDARPVVKVTTVIRHAETLADSLRDIDVSTLTPDAIATLTRIVAGLAPKVAGLRPVSAPATKTATA